MSERVSSFASRPLWLVGFRPFFLLACAAGALLPMLWALMFGGQLAAPAGRFTPLQWHAHEMFFGFGWAVLGGFLLTATKNWVHVRGYHGNALMVLVAAWLLERVGMAVGGEWPAALFWFSNLAFIGTLVAMLLATLLRHRGNDTFSDNYFFVIVLPLFVLAKVLMLSADHFGAAVTMSIGLYRMAFLVMLERTVTQFMKNTFQVTLWRNPRLDGAIKFSALALVAQPWLPAGLADGLLALCSGLLLLRFSGWHPLKALGRIELAVMYVGYLGIALQLLVELATRRLAPAWVGTVSVHLFTFGAMGLIIPPMLVRISKGHTGRKVMFDGGDKLLIWIMLLALPVRLLAPQWWPQAYPLWIHLAATCWLLCFGILGARLLPRVLAPRVDGKEH